MRLGRDATHWQDGHDKKYSPVPLSASRESRRRTSLFWQGLGTLAVTKHVARQSSAHASSPSKITEIDLMLVSARNLPGEAGQDLYGRRA